MDRPFGYGSGIFTGGANRQGEVSVGGVATWIDNEFSALTLELGIPGLLLFLTITTLLLLRCRILVKDYRVHGQAGALIAFIVLCPAAGLGGQWLTAFPMNCLFWTFAGLVVNLTGSQRSSQLHLQSLSFDGRKGVSAI